MKKIKILTIVLISILITMIAFGGIYTNNLNAMQNIVKEYNFTTDLEGTRVVSYTVSDNALEEDKNLENYKKAREIILKRLEMVNVPSYTVGLNEKTGRIDVNLIENIDTDNFIAMINQTGDFQIIDTETEEVLLSKENLKDVQIMTGATSYDSYSQIINLQFNFKDEYVAKLEEITKTYAEIEETEEVVEEESEEVEDAENEEVETEEEVQKTVSVILNGQELETTSFPEILTEGNISINIGTATDEASFQELIIQAVNVKAGLDTDTIPLELDLVQNKYIKSAYDGTTIINTVVILGLILSALVFILKLESKGVMATIITLITISSLLIVLRYANVEITLMSLAGLAVVFVLNAVLTIRVFKAEAEDSGKAILKTMVEIAPVIIIAVVFTFVSAIAMKSLGMIMFWGILLTLVVNYLITKNIANTK